MHTLQANDLDFMIQWIKFFRKPSKKRKFKMYKEIADKDLKYASKEIQLRQRKKLYQKKRRVHRHKLVISKVKEDNVECSVDNGYKHSKIDKGDHVFACFRKN